MPRRKKTPGPAEPDGRGAPKGERKRAPRPAAPPGDAAGDARERKDRRDGRRLEKGRSQDSADVRARREGGPAAAAEQRRKAEEYQTRYRSDPNLARYPVKPPPEEQQMRMHARVSRARHERRHSDVALPHTEAAAAPPESRPGTRAPAAAAAAAAASPPAFPAERTAEARAPGAKPPPSRSPPAPRHAPAPAAGPEPPAAEPLRKQGRLDPGSAGLLRKAKREKVETMLRNDSLSSDQSESVRPSPPKPHRARRGGKKRQLSVSSSEEEGVSTPEYTSCEDVELESESVSEKGEGAGPGSGAERGRRWDPDEAVRGSGGWAGRGRSGSCAGTRRRGRGAGTRMRRGGGGAGDVGAAVGPGGGVCGAGARVPVGSAARTARRCRLQLTRRGVY